MNLNKITIYLRCTILLIMLLNKHNIAQTGDYTGKTYKFVEADEKVLTLGAELSYKDIFKFRKIDNKDFLVVNPYRENKLFCYNYKTEDLEKRILFDKEGPNGVGIIQSVYTHNWDSIFIIGIFRPYIYIVNSAGKISSKINLSLSTPIITPSAHSWAAPLLYHHNVIYFGKMPRYEFGTELYLLSKHIVMYNTRTNLLYNNIGSYPYTYNIGIYLSDYSRIVTKNDDIVVSYPKSHYLYIYDRDTIKQRVKVQSRFLQDDFAKPPANIDNRHKAQEYAVETGTYSFLRYDPWKQYIYRVVLLPSILIDPTNGQKRTIAEKGFSIQIIDAVTYKLIDEIKMPNNIYDTKNIIPTPDGLLISTGNDFNPDLEEDRLVFKLFQLKRI